MVARPSPKVSVIVPVYNPGDHIDDCIASLLDQSLPTSEYEAIFVDDGSTDDTPARLDALAAAHDHVRVEHIPNSGWPGRPRNVGMDMARGEYVYFIDNDDWIEHEALERMYAMAVEDDADIVIGKVVGRGKFVPRGLFRETLHAVDLAHGPLLGLLTPHKLFRRSLLEDHGIRFPEGRRRLEDHVFVMHAYFHAQRISVLADYPCYHWVLRDSDTNASYRPFDPAGYYDNVREVLDLVEEHTEPGKLRNRLMRHWYRGKLLGRVGGTAFAQREPAYNRELHAEIRRLALERYGPRDDARLPLSLRLRGHLLRDGTYEALLALARREGDLRAKARLVRAEGDETELTFDVEAELTGDAEGPLTFRHSGDRVHWVPPAGLRDVLGDKPLDVTREMPKSRVQVLIRGANGTEYQLPGVTEVQLVPVEGQPDGTVRAVLLTQARLTPAVAAAGAPLPPGDWEVRALVTITGFSADRAVKHDGSAVVLRCTLPAHVVWTSDPRLADPATKLKRRLARRMPALVRLVKQARNRRASPAPS